MNRIALKFSVGGAIVIASVAAPWLIHRHARVQWIEREAFLRQQSAQFAELSAENNRLSNLVAQTSSSCLSGDQFRELMKLRGEIGQMRKDAGEAARLKSANQPLLAASGNSAPSPGPAPPEPQTVLAYWPKAQLTSAGYADPTSGLRTALWAMSRNDPIALATSVTPQILSELTSERYVGNTPADRLATGTKWVADSLGPSSGFYVVAQKMMSQDQAILDVYFEKEAATRRFRLMKIADEWKLGGIFLVGGTEDEPLAVPRFWP